MKKINQLFLLCLMVGLVCACSHFSNRGTIDKPFITSASTNTFSIERVTLSDTATVLDAVVNFRPGWWFQVADSSYIVADGQKYSMTGIEGIATNEHVTVPDSGVVHFTMFFPAIPANVKSIDFTEGFADGYAVRGIDLTGTADDNINLSLIPAEARKPFVDGALPEPVLKYDTTTVNVHLLGYVPEMGDISYMLYTLRGFERPDYATKPDSLGNAQFKFALAGPAYMRIRGNNNLFLSGGAHLAPGENIDLYVDTHVSGIDNMLTRDGKEWMLPEGYKASYHNGIYGNLDRISGLKGEHMMQLYNGKFADFHMNGNEYTDYVLNLFDALNDSIDSADIPAMAKEMEKVNLQVQLAVAATTSRSILNSNYWNKYGNWGSPIPADSINIELSPENARRFAEKIDFNDQRIYLSQDAGDAISTGFWHRNGINPGIYEGLSAYYNDYNKANDASLTEVSPDLAKAPESFSADVRAHNQFMKDKLSKLDFSKVTPTPDVPAEKIIAEITKPYRGKVVMIDLWNTWCGPCRAALAQNEPAKSADLSSDDIVWIYIADESSSTPLYLDMINDIRGIHYHVTADQIARIRKQFDVDGIPFYILVDKQGRAQGRPDLRDHDKFKRTILSELAK